METRCKGTNRDEQPCSAHVYEGEEWCRWHDPAREADRAEWRRRGGQNKSNKNRARKKMAEAVMSISDLDALLCAALQQVADGTMEPGVGTAMASMARTITGIRQASDLETRLSDLEVRAGLASPIPFRRVKS